MAEAGRGDEEEEVVGDEIHNPAGLPSMAARPDP